MKFPNLQTTMSGDNLQVLGSLRLELTEKKSPSFQHLQNTDLN